MNVFTVYLWLSGCESEWLTEEKLEPVLLKAVEAARFELLYTHVSEHEGKIVALAVVGESHVVLHADVEAQSLCAEVLSCTTRESAQAAIDAVRETIAHESHTAEWVSYEVENGFE